MANMASRGPSNGPVVKTDGKQVPLDVVTKASSFVGQGATSADLKAFMKSQGYPMTGMWCGQFVAAVVKASGGTPVNNPGWANNWTAYGKPVARSNLKPGDSGVVTFGRHVAFFSVGEDGKITELGGNQRVRDEQGKPIRNTGQYEGYRTPYVHAVTQETDEGLFSKFGKGQVQYHLNPPGVMTAIAAVADPQTAPKASAGRGSVTPEAQSVYSLLTKGNPALGVAPLPAHIAAGSVGNMMQESYADLRPGAKGAGGELGIGQWMPDRYANMVAWTTANGLDPNSREGQALFYSHEMQASPAWSMISQAQTPSDAAQLIASKFERAGTPMMDRRMAYANAVAGAPATDAVNAMATGRAIPAPSMATIAPSRIGADQVIKSSVEGDAPHLTDAWNKLVSNVRAGGLGAISEAKDYFSKVSRPAQEAAATSFAFNPELMKSVPAIVRPMISAPMGKVWSDIQERVSGGNAAAQMGQFGLFQPQDKQIPFSTHDQGQFMTPVVSEASLLSAPGYDYTPKPSPAETYKPVSTPSTNEFGSYLKDMSGLDPDKVGSMSMADLGMASPDVVNARQALSMATSQPPGYEEGSPFQQALPVSSTDYALGSLDLGTDVPDVGTPPTLEYQQAAPAAPVQQAAPSMATTPPPSKGLGGRIYRAISQPIAPSSTNFWSGPMTQPFFTAGAGGATLPYQRNVTDASGNQRTQPDQYGNRVNVGVYTDSHGNQHEYTWSPSGAP